MDPLKVTDEEALAFLKCYMRFTGQGCSPMTAKEAMVEAVNRLSIDMIVEECWRSGEPDQDE